MNVTADINDFRLLFLDTSHVSRVEMCLPCFDVVNGLVEVVGNLIWGSYLRVVKCDAFVLCHWRRFSVYCLLEGYDL